jgi:vitamin B12 transporter
MTPTIYRIALATVALACSLILLPLPSAFAGQPSERLSERAWEEIIVVGSHLPRPAREVGSAVTVLRAHDIDVRQVNLGSELLREVPGLAVNRSGQVGNVTQVRIRGAEGNHTLVLIDGIEANDPGFGSEFNFADLLTYDVGRIEVLRGPQSALYGSDAIGGVISISTAEPDRGFSAHGEVERGSFGSRQLGASLSGGSEAVSGRLSATRYDTDGISASAIEPERDGYQTNTVHGKLDVALTEQLSARLVLRQADNEVESDRQDFDFPPTATEGLIVDADDVSESRQRYGLMELNAELLDGRWLQRAAVGYTDTESDNFSSGSRVSGNRGERTKVEYQTTVRLGDGTWDHALTGGIQRELLEFEGLSATIADANQTRKDDQTSFVAEYALTHGRRASASLSVRHDNNDRFDDATTFRVTGSYLFDATGTRWHASYGEGITNPSFVELFGFAPTSFQGNPDLQPEQSESYDVGVEQSLFEGHALVDVTYFHATLSDEITTVFDFDTFTSTAVNQPGESDRQGVELEVQAQLGPLWSVHGSYTWLDATEPDGRREVRRPRHSGSVNVNYQFLDGRGNINLGAVFNGAQQDNEFISSTPESRVTLDDYTLVNAAVTYDLSARLQLFVRGENLLDEGYTEVFGYRSPGAAGYLGMRARL